MYSYGSPHTAAQKQDDQHERTFSSYVRIQVVVLKTYLGRWTIGRSGERGSGISVLPARDDDDDDDDCCQLYREFYEKKKKKRIKCLGEIYKQLSCLEISSIICVCVCVWRGDARRNCSKQHAASLFSSHLVFSSCVS